MVSSKRTLPHPGSLRASPTGSLEPTRKPGAKADDDYDARLASVDPAERADGTFVFVTPRNWPGKSAWEKQKSAAGDWKAVRAFDASDLEQWLEQSVPAQIWLAEQLALPVRWL